MDRTERFAPLATGIALAIPTLVAHYLPMSDLPLHEGVVGILRHYGDPAYFDPGLYRLNIGHANQLFHILALGLSYVVGTTWAVKLLIAAAQIGIMLSCATVADHVGRSRWGVVLAAPLLLGFTYYWGLVANLLGFVGFFYALPLIDRALVAPTVRSLLKLCALLMVLFFAHESAFIIAIAFTTLLAFSHPFDRRQTALRFVPLLFGLGFLTAYFFWSRRFFTHGQVAAPVAWLKPLDKLRFLPADLFGSHDELTRVLLFVVGTCAIVLLALARVRSGELRKRASSEGRILRAQAWIHHYRFEILGFGFFVAFCIAPQTWNGITLIQARFVGPAWALAAITAAPRGDAPGVARGAILAVPLGILLLAWPQFIDSDRTYKNLDALIARIPKNSAVALTALDRTIYRTRVYSAAPGPARSVADVGGRMSLSLVNSPLSPVQINPEYRWNEFDRAVFQSSSRAFKPRYDLDRFGWVIAQSRDPAIRAAIIVGFKPDAELVEERGEWILLRSTHPQLPLKSPEGPRPAGETIADRVFRILTETQQSSESR